MARTRRGLHQGEVARRLGVSRSALSAWERGSERPTPANLLRLREMIHRLESERAAPPAPAQAQLEMQAEPPGAVVTPPPVDPEELARDVAAEVRGIHACLRRLVAIWDTPGAP